MQDTIRVQVLQRICKAYKPTVSASFVIQELCFDTEEQGYEFLQKAACILTDASEGKEEAGLGHTSAVAKALEINTKDTVIDPSGVFTQDKLLA
jgi:hypothetical protein